jgi:hypothetical protein
VMAVVMMWAARDRGGAKFSLHTLHGHTNCTYKQQSTASPTI